MLLYIFKRLALMVPTLFGVLLLTFVVIQFVPGGPVEQYLAEAKSGAGGGSAEGAGLSYRGSQGVTPSALPKPKPCMDLISRRQNGFGRCWCSFRTLI